MSDLGGLRAFLPDEVLRREVVTPAGYCVAVPERIWKAWPSAHRRLVRVSSEEARRLDAMEATFDADAPPR